MHVVYIGGVLWAALAVFYVLYLAAVNVWGKRADLKGKTLTVAVVLPVLAAMLIVDFIMQVTIFTVLFLDIPRDWLVTLRLQRYRQQANGWRHDVACWICENFLNPFDPSGKHC